MVSAFAGLSVLLIGIFLFIAFALMPARISNRLVRYIAQWFFITLALGRAQGIVKALDHVLVVDSWALALTVVQLTAGLAFCAGMWREIVVKGHVVAWDR